MICQSAQKGSFAGDCNAGFQCTGDAVQCATAQVEWKKYCLINYDKNDPMIAVGQSVVAGADVGQSAAVRSETNVENWASNNITRHWVAVCPAPVTVQVMGKAATMSFDKMCPWLEYIGNFGVALAWLGFVTMMYKSAKG